MIFGSVSPKYNLFFNHSDPDKGKVDTEDEIANADCMLHFAAWLLHNILCGLFVLWA